MGFDFNVIVPLFSSHHGFSFVLGCGGIFFLACSNIFLLTVVQQLVAILVFEQER
jgi:hypothetical protein